MKINRQKILAGLSVTLDSLMFVLPVLEMAEVTQLIPVEYLPLYLLVVVGVRRGVRILEKFLQENTEQ